jgi:hypothetical protein
MDLKGDTMGMVKEALTVRTDEVYERFKGKKSYEKCEEIAAAELTWEWAAKARAKGIVLGQDKKVVH